MSTVVSEAPRSALRFAARTIAAAVLPLPAYALLAYVVLPVSWRRYERSSVGRDAAGITRTAEGIPGDPLNVALVGNQDEVIAAMRAASWVLADRITVRSGLRDAASVLLDRPYPSAPMSTHFLQNRPQDLAFERVAGRSPRIRHHVRLWRMSDPEAGGPPTWLGAATFDRGLGLSRYTGEVMHHIDPNVDAEREKLFADLDAAGRLERRDCIEAFLPPGESRNGGGDWYRTDGTLCVGQLRPSGRTANAGEDTLYKH
jgi:hypothetical protein